MNSDLMREIADHVESEPASFDMRVWGVHTDCGTSYCVAGWAVVLTQPELMAEFLAFIDALEIPETHRFIPQTFLGWDHPAFSAWSEWTDKIEDVALAALGLSESDDTIFHCGWEQSPQEAAVKLRKFADAGEIDIDLWDDREEDPS